MKAHLCNRTAARTLGVIATLALVGLSVFAPQALAQADKTEICHFNVDSDPDAPEWELVSVRSGNAVEKHVEHGDGFPNAEVPGTGGAFVFDGSCVPTPASVPLDDGDESFQLTEDDFFVLVGNVLDNAVGDGPLVFEVASVTVLEGFEHVLNVEIESVFLSPPHKVVIDTLYQGRVEFIFEETGDLIYLDDHLGSWQPMTSFDRVRLQVEYVVSDALISEMDTSTVELVILGLDEPSA